MIPGAGSEVDPPSAPVQRSDHRRRHARKGAPVCRRGSSTA